MKRPTIFLSSTVFDFADLRSALKDYLELRGCRVQASEFTDFERPLDTHSYDACLKAIEQADVFVLLIGRRTGGWYSERDQISITHAEFLHAHKLAQQGKIKILCFVRSDVWAHRQSIRDLEKNLSGLSEAEREKQLYNKTMAMDKPKAIIKLIDEVARNNETVQAVRGLGKPPIANWIWQFDTFGQIRQAIDPLILSGMSVADAAGRKSLERQVYLLLQNTLPRLGASTMDPGNLVLSLHRTLNLTTAVIDKNISIDQKTWEVLALLLISSNNVTADPSAIVAHLSSGLLLEYEPKSGSFVQTPEYEVLVKLIDQAKLLQTSEKPNLSNVLAFGPRTNHQEDRIVPGHIVIGWMYRLLRWAELISLAKALANSLAGNPLVIPKIYPTTPVIDQEDMLNSEKPTLSQVKEFVLGQ